MAISKIIIQYQNYYSTNIFYIQILLAFYLNITVVKNATLKAISNKRYHYKALHFPFGLNVYRYLSIGYEVVNVQLLLHHGHARLFFRVLWFWYIVVEYLPCPSGCPYRLNQLFDFPKHTVKAINASFVGGRR